MKTLRLFCIIAIGILVTSMAMALTDTATQNIGVTVEEIAQIAASGDVAGNLVLANANTTAGSLPLAASDFTTTLDWTSNVDSGKTRTVTANLDTAMPANVLLKVVLSDGTGDGTPGTFAAQQTLTDAAKDLVTAVGNGTITGVTVTYEASLTHMVAPQQIDRTVTWTITDDQ